MTVLCCLPLRLAKADLKRSTLLVNLLISIRKCLNTLYRSKVQYLHSHKIVILEGRI